MTPKDRKAVVDLLEDNDADHAPLDDDEPKTEDLVEMLRESIEDVKAGRTRPVEELLRELDEILAEEDNAS